MTTPMETTMIGRTRKKCAHPGCLVVLHRSTSTFDTGFCRHHGGQHKGRATVAPRAALPQEVARDGIRAVYVPALAGMQSSTVEPKLVRVSLPKEPWA